MASNNSSNEKHIKNLFEYDQWNLVQKKLDKKMIIF